MTETEIGLKTLLPKAVLGVFAKWGMMLSCLFFGLSLITTLPFHPLWGFILVPIGAIFSWAVGKKLDEVG